MIKIINYLKKQEMSRCARHDVSIPVIPMRIPVILSAAKDLLQRGTIIIKLTLVVLITVMITTSYSHPNDSEIKAMLTPMQYYVTQENGTEKAFENEYWDNKREGIYVDVVSGEPLFSSIDKYDSGTGWPSFTKPLESENITLHEDNGWFSTRTEVRSKTANSHLGHVFNDGPQPTGLRYCMNSAALRFIPVESLESEGYGKYNTLFKTSDKK